MGGKYGNKRAIAPEREREVVGLYKQVHCMRVVADAFGVSDETIRRILKRNGVPRRKPNHEKTKAKTTNNKNKGIDREKVGELYRSGMSTCAIAKQLGCSSGAVYYHLDKLGLYKVGERKAENDAFIPQIVELHEQGLSDYEIADMLGISRCVVNKRMHDVVGSRGKGKTFSRECVCPRCGKRFKTMVKNQEFCSQACRNAAHWQYRDDEKRANTDGPVEEITLREIYDRDRGRCYICGERTDWNDYRIVNGFKVVGPRYPSRDHVIALHNGGTHTRDNIRLACWSCNSLKSDKGQMRLAI